MPVLIKSVDKTKVTYEDSFNFRIDVSFNGIEGSIDSARIIDFIPDEVEFVLPAVSIPIRDIQLNTVTGGQEIIFDFGAIDDLGTSSVIQFEANFSKEAQNLMTFTNTARLEVNGEEILVASAEEVQLEVVGRFALIKNLAVPSGDPAPGGQLIYELMIENLGDKWVPIQNVVIEDILPPELTIDTTFLVGGKDISEGEFADTSADGITGTIEENTFTFEIPDYRGYKYKFLIRATVNSDIEVGEVINNTVTWQIDGVPQTATGHTINVTNPSYEGDASSYAPTYTQPGNLINYELFWSNTGNQLILNTNIINKLSPLVKPTYFHSGSFYYGIEDFYFPISGEYEVTYTTLNGESGSVGIFNTDTNTTVDLSTLGIADDDQIASFVWSGIGLPVGVTAEIPTQIDGIVDPGASLPGEFVNNLTMEWEDPDGNDYEDFSNTSTTVADISVLDLELRRTTSGNVRPGDTVTYRMIVDARGSQVNEPILSDLLPEQLEYVGNVRYRRYDYFSGDMEDSNSGNVTIPMPPVEYIEKYNDSGQNLVRFSYVGDYSYSFRQKAWFEIWFDTKVKVGYRGQFDNYAYLGNWGARGAVGTGMNIYNDTLDLDGDGVTLEQLVISRRSRSTILFTTSISSDGKVKGALNVDYVEEPELGRTYEGGSVDYRLAIFNDGNVDIEQVEVVNILPHVGDTGVIQTSQSRGSQYAFRPIASITARIEPLDPEQSEPTIQIEYSRSYDPVRFGDELQVIGVDDDWTTQEPLDITDMASIKITTQDTLLRPGQSLVIEANGIAPVGSEVDQEAWNSFAAKVTYTDEQGELANLLPVEPEKVGVIVVEDDPSLRSIGGFAWQDENRDGIYQDTEKGVDDIIVVLYDQAGSALRVTVTTPTTAGEEGYYLFNNIEPGEYYVRFLPNFMEYYHSPQHLDDPNGSMPDPLTGVTPVIDVNEDSVSDINAGFIPLSQNEKVDKLIRVNKSTKGMVRNVIYNQMLLGMKQEEVGELIEKLNK